MMKYQLFHAESFDPTSIAGTLSTEGIETTPVHSPDDLAVGERPTILLLDPAAEQLCSVAS